MTTFRAAVGATVLAALLIPSVCSGQAANEPSSQDAGTGGASKAAPQPEKVPEIMRLAGEKFDLRRAIRLHSSEFAGRNRRVEDLNRELAINATDRKRLDALREKADQLRSEITGKSGEPSQSGEGSAESVEETGFFNRFSRWLNTRYSDPSQDTQKRREAAQVDESLRNQGVTVEIDGEQRTERFDSLAQLEAFLEEQTRALDGVEQQNLENRDLAAEELEKHNAEAERLQASLDEVESKMNAEAEKIPQFTPAANADLGPLLDAIVEGFDAQPSEPATPGTTETTPTSDSAATGAAGPLMQDLAGDLMTPSEYQQHVEERSQANPVVDEETRRQAVTIDQQLAVTEAALAEAERRHQQLVQQNAQAEQIRRAWAQQEAIRGQWLQQQYLQQNFGQAVQQAFGGSRSSASGGSPTITRSGGSTRSSSIQRQTGSTSGNRRSGNAAGIDSLLQPVRDPVRAQQLQETFGNRNRKK